VISRTALFLVLVASTLPGVASDSAPVIDVADAYVRAVPPGQPNSAAFMNLTNRGGAARALVAAASPSAEVVELHTHAMVDGMMRMRQIEQIDVAPGATVNLAPGGLHVMLIGLTGPLGVGDTVTLTLEFDDGQRVEISAPVRPVDGMMMPQHRH
jgi:copper(I)-binding protein